MLAHHAIVDSPIPGIKILAVVTPGVSYTHNFLQTY